MTGRLVDTLQALEQELRSLGLWAETPPSPTALASRQPFCIDTMAFEQWLQWVFIPRMTELAAAGVSTLADCEIQSMGEEAFAHLGRRGHELVAILGRVDQQVTELP